jgi:hypothetical protein
MSAYDDQINPALFSECCDAPMMLGGICSECREHAETQEDEELIAPALVTTPIRAIPLAVRRECTLVAKRAESGLTPDEAQALDEIYRQQDAEDSAPRPTEAEIAEMARLDATRHRSVGTPHEL